eukprot:6550491-Pyramimonas_sp.AAC.1
MALAPVTPPRTVTAYQHFNEDVTHAFQKGVLYLDGQTGLVQWQCGSNITRWHGSWNFGDGTFRIYSSTAVLVFAPTRTTSS